MNITSITNPMQLVAKTALVVMSRWAIMTVPAIFVNFVFAIFYFFSLQSPSSQSVEGYALLAFFLGFFPLGYFIIAKTYAVRKGLNYAFNQKKAFLFEYVIRLIIDKNKGMALNNTNVKALIGTSGKLLEQLDKAPKAIQFIMNYMLDKVPFREALESTVREKDITKENAGNISEELAEQLDVHLTVNLFKTRLFPFILLLITNFAVILMATIFVGG